VTANPLEVTVRTESPSDVAAIHDLVTAAFADEPAVAGLVDELRANGHLVLSLVAELDGAVIGHVGFSPVSFEPPQPALNALQLSPLGVLPSHQRRGIGGALVRQGLETCRELGVDAVFLLGHPGYYPRFGFQPARNLGVHYQDDRDAFMGIALRPGALASINAKLLLSPEFARFE
jgi:putative acetyltransferase